MDAPRPQRNRIHVDVWVPHDQAEARIAAAIEAGGRLVNDENAPAWWTLADAEGNEVDVATWQGRDDDGARRQVPSGCTARRAPRRCGAPRRSRDAPLAICQVPGGRVVDALPGDGVDVLRSHQDHGPDVGTSGGVHRQGERSGGRVVGKLAERVDVVLAEGEVEGLHAPTEIGGRPSRSRWPGPCPFLAEPPGLGASYRAMNR